MTAGTSPHAGSLSSRWTDAAMIFTRTRAGLWPARALDRKINWTWLARGAAALHLLALVLIVGTAWQEGVGLHAAEDGGLSVLLLVLIATGTAAALLALRPGEWRALGATPDGAAASEASPQLLAQLSHELRTPLNAVIGFSEVMLHELHGPLGHARYQEYAAHISESGGRLLKVSEDTLAVTATMAALMADRRALRRERVRVRGLLQDAWAAAAAADCNGGIELAPMDSGDAEIVCDGRVAAQALEQLLREAVAGAHTDAAVEARVRRRGDARTIDIDIRVRRPLLSQPWAAAASHSPLSPCRVNSPLAAGGGLRVLLARALLEMQGATLSVSADEGGPWSACIAFPAVPCRQDI